MGARSPHDSTALKWSRMHGFPPAEYSSNMERVLPTPRDVSAVTWLPVSYWLLKSCNNTASCNIEHLSSRTYYDATTNISPTAEYLFALFNGKKNTFLFFFIYWEVFSQSMPIYWCAFLKGFGMERTFALYNLVFLYFTALMLWAELFCDRQSHKPLRFSQRHDSTNRLFWTDNFQKWFRDSFTSWRNCVIRTITFITFFFYKVSFYVSWWSLLQPWFRFRSIYFRT